MWERDGKGKAQGNEEERKKEMRRDERETDWRDTVEWEVEQKKQGDEWEQMWGGGGGLEGGKNRTELEEREHV